MPAIRGNDDRVPHAFTDCETTCPATSVVGDFEVMWLLPLTDHYFITLPFSYNPSATLILVNNVHYLSGDH